MQNQEWKNYRRKRNNHWKENHLIVFVLLSFNRNIIFIFIGMESYHRVKKLLEEKYGKWIIPKPYNDDNGVVDNGIVDNKQRKSIKQITDISGEEGLRLAYETKDGLYQHYNKSFIAGTKDFPTDHIDDLKLYFNDTLDKTKRGRDADAYYRSHHETDTVIGHRLGGAVALSLKTI